MNERFEAFCGGRDSLPAKHPHRAVAASPAGTATAFLFGVALPLVVGGARLRTERLNRERTGSGLRSHEKLAPFGSFTVPDELLNLQRPSKGTCDLTTRIQVWPRDYRGQPFLLGEVFDLRRIDYREFDPTRVRIPAIVIAQSGHRDRRFWAS